MELVGLLLVIILACLRYEASAHDDAKGHDADQSDWRL